MSFSKVQRLHGRRLPQAQEDTFFMLQRYICLGSICIFLPRHIAVLMLCLAFWHKKHLVRIKKVLRFGLKWHRNGWRRSDFLCKTTGLCRSRIGQRWKTTAFGCHKNNWRCPHGLDLQSPVWQPCESPLIWYCLVQMSTLNIISRWLHCCCSTDSKNLCIGVSTSHLCSNRTRIWLSEYLWCCKV